jgi:hypothetical protein
MKMEAEGDVVRSPQFGTVHGDVYLGDKSPVSQPQNITAPLVPKSEKKPVLVISERSGARELTYDSDDALWKDDSNGKRMLVIPVTNPIPEDGGESIKANRISVHLVFKFESHLVMDFERAYWVGESSNEVDFIAGKKRNVLIGYQKNNEWCSFENTHSYPQSTGGMGTWFVARCSRGEVHSFSRRGISIF